jgi:hypothetical protein
MRRVNAIIATIFIALIGASSIVYAQTPRLQWDASPSANVAGYIVYYGVTSGALANSVDVGNSTQWVLDGLEPGLTYYFNVKAYNTSGLLSSPAVQVSYDVPALPPYVAGPRTGLIWQHAVTGALAEWEVDGTRQVTGASLTPGAVADTNWKIVATGDFDGDGQRDLVWQHTNGTISTWLMRGNTLVDGRLFEPSTAGNPDWRVVAAGDMNRDGKCDLIWRNRTTGVMAVWYMDGTRRLNGVLISPDTVSDPNWEIVGAADFDGDSQTDLLWRNKAQGWLSVWFMNGIVMREGRSLAPTGVADVGWSIQAVNDINGDGRPDIIWEHTDGRIAAWIMNGHTMTSGVLFTPDRVVDPNWRIVGAR